MASKLPDITRTRAFLRELCDAVLLHLQALDAEMKRPSDAERGRRIATLAGRLEVANDRCRYFALGLDFREDPTAKRQETATAAGIVAAERARIRASLLRAIQEAPRHWIVGAEKSAVETDSILEALDRICPESEG